MYIYIYIYIYDAEHGLLRCRISSSRSKRRSEYTEPIRLALNLGTLTIAASSRTQS